MSACGHRGEGESRGSSVAPASTREHAARGTCVPASRLAERGQAEPVCFGEKSPVKPGAALLIQRRALQFI